MCRLFGEEFNQYLIQGKWEGSSAGGAHKVVLAQEKLKGKKSSSSKEGKEGGAPLPPTRPDARRGNYEQEDGDVRWFNNPQYRIEVTKETECYITLMQRDARLRGNNISGGGGGGGGEGKSNAGAAGAASSEASNNTTHFFSDFTLLRQRRSDRRRLWEHVPDDVVCSGSDSHFANPAHPTREVAKASVRLSPKYAYVLVPHTKKWGVELPYTVRIFTTGEMTVEALPELYARTFEGAWNIDPDSAITAGGPLRSKNSRSVNPRWTQNPQYLVRLPKLATSRPGVGAGTVSLKIVVSRTDKTNVNKGKREGSRNYAALAVVKPDPPHTDGKKRRAAITNFMGEPLSPSHKKKKKQGAGEGKEDGGAGAGSKDERAPLSYGSMRSVDRKLAVTAKEWCVSSEGTDREVASVLLPNVRQSWCEHGLLVVPSLMRVDLMGSYVVRVYSDHPVLMEELPQISSRTIPDAWTEQHSGGMHMNAEWKRNPKFTLELRPRGNEMNGGEEQQQVPPQRVKITLRRPEDRWRKKCAKDNAVDCMMGFYVVAGTRVTKEPTGIYHQNVPWTMTGFVPIHEISTPDGFFLDVLPNEEVYTIMPVTYSPGITGPFFITVEASCDFVLKGK
jgi:hypothetical protein